MADVVTRLVVESKEYDSKIARATQGLTQFEKKCREVGGTLEFVEKEDLEFVKALGQMDTVASSATGKLGELKKAFTELSVQYQNLTKAEKQSPYGKALASSLDQLKGRISNLQGDLSKAQSDMTGFGSAFEQIGSKLGIPTGMFTKLGPAVAAASAALKVAKDAFLQTESGIDTWGRAMEGGKAAYTTFLNTLNNGNWSNFFSNLYNAITGAGKLYDAMDRLGSIKANNQAAIAKEQATIQELRLRQQKGENVAKELREAEERLRKLQNEAVEQGKTAGAEQMKQTLTNSVNSIKGNGGWFRKDTTAKVAESDIDAAIQDILEHGQDAMDRYAEQYSKLTEKATKTITETRYSQGGQAYTVTRKEFDINTLTAEEQKMYKLAKGITDSETSLQQGIQTYATALQEGASANREAFQTERFAQKGDRQAAAAEQKQAAPEGSIAAMREQLSQLNKDWELAVDDDSRAKLKEQIDEVSAALDKMTGKAKTATAAVEVEGPSGYSQEGISALRKQMQDSMKGMQVGSKDYIVQAQNLVDLTAFENLLKTAVANGIELDPTMLEGFFESIDTGAFNIEPAVSDEAWETFVDTINEKLAELDLPPIELDVKTGNVEKLDKQVGSLEQNLTGAINVFGQLGDAMQQIDDPGAKVAGIIMGAIANIAGTFAASLKGTFTPWDWIAAAISGTAVMISTIAAIKSATAGSYASGGIVPGNSFSGDNLTANVNSGELILNRSQQDNIASQLTGNNPMQNLQLSTEISGTNLRIVMNNDNRSKGGSRGYYANIH